MIYKKTTLVPVSSKNKLVHPWKLVISQKVSYKFSKFKREASTNHSFNGESDITDFLAFSLRNELFYVPETKKWYKANDNLW
jgi:hypothetical protein